jgi:molybdopterin-guanine dinucleotide biosynthesis protein A
MTTLDAIIIAGGDPKHDTELLAHAGGAPRKARIELGGATFLERIVAALLGSEHVGRVVVVGLPAEYQTGLGPRVSYVPDAGGMFENGASGIEYLRSTGQISERILLSSCDIPLITPQIVSDTLDLILAHDVDFGFSIVSQDVMERAFPGSGRTFVTLRDGRYAGGDLHLIKAGALDANRAVLDEFIGERKTFWRQIRAVGLDILFLFLIRRLTIARAERQIQKALGITGKAVICPYAQIAMDVDKPHHLDVVRAAWDRQQR